MSLETPSKIRMLQRKLYLKAKEEPTYRFYLLYDKIYREDILAFAYELAKSNQGAPGVDGQSFQEIESQGLEKWLIGIRDELHAKTYKPPPGFGIITRRTGCGLYVLACSSTLMPISHFSKPCDSISWKLCPSTPGAPWLDFASS